MTATANLTDLLRHPKDVIELVHSDGQVRVTRRGHPDLVILRSDRHDAITRGTDLAARVIRAFAANDNDMKAALAELFAWTAVFDDEAMERYAAEMKRWVFAAAELNAYEKLLQIQSGWQATAEAYAEGYEPVRIDAEFLADSEAVGRP